MSADVPLRWRVEVFRNTANLHHAVSLMIRDGDRMAWTGLTVAEAKEVAKQLNTLANEQRRRQKRWT